MKNNSGYLITRENAFTVSLITGIPLSTLEANMGWVAVYSEDEAYVVQKWALIPKSIAEKLPDFAFIEHGVYLLADKLADFVDDIAERSGLPKTTVTEMLEAGWIFAHNDGYQRWERQQ